MCHIDVLAYPYKPPSYLHPASPTIHVLSSPLSQLLLLQSIDFSNNYLDGAFPLITASRAILPPTVATDGLGTPKPLLSLQVPTLVPMLCAACTLAHA